MISRFLHFVITHDCSDPEAKCSSVDEGASPPYMSPRDSSPESSYQSPHSPVEDSLSTSPVNV